MAKRSDPTPAVLRTRAHSHSHGRGQDRASEPTFDAEQWELENVHDVYASIASHFSATRYKPWPLVSDFLASLPPGSLGVDVGCGNGKYLHLRNLLHQQSVESPSVKGDCIIVGVDRSAELIEFARHQSLRKMNRSNIESGDTQEVDDEADTAERLTPTPMNEVAVGDALTTGFRSRAFDFAISIATIHHLSTPQRRLQSIQELIRLIRPVAIEEGQTEGGSGRFLVYVWALEQKGQERRKFDEQDRRMRGEDVAQASPSESVVGRDVLVPWVLKAQQPVRKAEKWPGVAEGSCSAEQVYQRYYHLFEATELESLVEEAAATLRDSHLTGTDGRSIQVVKEDSGWERGNWWGIWKVLCSEAVPPPK